MITGVGVSVAVGSCSAPTRSPKCFTNSDQLVISFASLAGVASFTVTGVNLPAFPLIGAGSVTLSGTMPMKPAVPVPTPAIGRAEGGTCSTYTPGDRYSGILSLLYTFIHLLVLLSG